MCGRFSLYQPVDDLVEQFAVDEVAVTEEPPPRWNVAPTDPVLAVATSRDGTVRKLGTFRWGLVPSFAQDTSGASRMINARAETLATSNAYRRAFRTRRCLIPANGFYEWERVVPPGGGKPVRHPFHLHAADRSPLALAGLWEVWHGPEDVTLRTCTIITTTPNALVAPLHDRMPVIVPPTAWDEWLAPEVLDPVEAAGLLAPAPDDLLVLDPVGDAVNNVRNDGPELVVPVPG